MRENPSSSEKKLFQGLHNYSPAILSLCPCGKRRFCSDDGLLSVWLKSSFPFLGLVTHSLSSASVTLLETHFLEIYPFAFLYTKYLSSKKCTLLCNYGMGKWSQVLPKILTSVVTTYWDSCVPCQLTAHKSTFPCAKITQVSLRVKEGKLFLFLSMGLVSLWLMRERSFL